MKYFRTQAESLENARSERVDEDISLGDETFGDGKSCWILGVEHNRAFSFAKHVVGRTRRPVDACDGGAVVCENKTGEWSWRQTGKLVRMASRY